MGQLNLPNVHGYGVPQILSQWQAGQSRREEQRRYETELGMRKEQFAMQQAQFKSQQEDRNQTRRLKAQDNMFRLFELGNKYEENEATRAVGMQMIERSIKGLNKVFPGFELDLSEYANAKERKRGLIEKSIAAATDLQKRAKAGDAKAIAMMGTTLIGLRQLKVPEEIIKTLSDYQPEKVETPQPPKTREVKVGDEIVTQQWNPATGKFEPLARAPRFKEGPGVEVTVDLGAKSLVELNKAMAKDIPTARTDAMGAVKGLENLFEAKKILNAGIITGTGAEFITGFGNMLSSRLGFTEFEDPVANTQAFAATMGTQVGQIIKQFGAGTGLSDADREYAEKIVGGKITINEKAIKKLMTINEKAFKNVIKNYNTVANEIMTKPGAGDLLYDLRIKMPEEMQQTQPQQTAPQSQQPAAQYQEGQTATGPGGVKMVFKNGKWEKM